MMFTALSSLQTTFIWRAFCRVIMGIFLIFSVLITIMILLSATKWVAVKTLPYGFTQYITLYDGPVFEEYSFDRLSIDSDHSVVAAAILRCQKTDATSGLSNAMQSVLAGVDGITLSNDNAPLEPSLQFRAAQLSSTIKTKRLSLDQTSNKSYNFLQISTVTTIVVGMLTSILVMLTNTNIGTAKTIQADWLKYLSMIFPILGTAISAIVAFYGPAESYAKSQQFQAALSALHFQVVTEAAKLDCTKDPKSPAWTSTSAKFDNLENQYSTLLNTLSSREVAKEKKEGS